MIYFLSILLFILSLGTAYAQSIPSITWTNDRGGSGTATGVLPGWSVNSIPLGVGINNICVTYTNANGSAQDCIGVTYQPSFPGNALVGAWGFEDGSGTTTVDSSGNTNTGFLTNGPTWSTSGKFGKAIQFDGVNDYVLVQDANSLDLTQSFTLSAWVFPTAVHTDWRAVVVKNYVQYLYATNGGSGSCTSGAILGGFAAAETGTNRVACQAAGNAIPVGQWTHLAVAYDNAASTLSLYRDGVQVATTTISGLMAPSTGSLQIGASTFGENFEGLIDEVRVYNWKIPLTAGSNTVPGATCVFGNPLDTAQQSIVRDMNCPVIQTITTPLPIKIPASATGLKVGASATGLKFGSKAP